MGEKKKIIQRGLDYDGIVDFKQFFRRIDVFLRDYYYDKKETKNFQYNIKSGKQYEIELQPWKKVTDYYKIILKLELLATKIKEVEVDTESGKKLMQQGNIHIKLTGYLIVDYADNWNMPGKPLYYFIRELFDRVVYSEVYNKYANMVMHDSNELYAVMASFLNVERFDKVQ